MPYQPKTDGEFKAYQEGAKIIHKTSPETRNLIKKMEDKFDKKFDYLNNKVTDFNTEMIKNLGDVKLEIIEAMNNNMKDVKEECDKKYAPAWVATALKLVMGSTFLAVLGSIMSLILK